MAKEWHYAWQGKSEGPVEETMIFDLIRAGRVRAETLVWSEGMGEWERADLHFSFGAAAPRGTVEPPPLSPAQRSVQSAGSYPGGASGPHDGAPPREFVEAIRVCFQKYATFRGRASRSEFWWFVLFLAIGSLVTGFLPRLMGNDGAVLNGLFSLATFLPSISVQVRRLHDTGRSGWWIGGYYLALIPVGFIVGIIAAAADQTGSPGTALLGLLGLIMLGSAIYGILMLVFLLSRGTPGPNRFG